MGLDQCYGCQSFNTERIFSNGALDPFIDKHTNTYYIHCKDCGFKGESRPC